VVFDRDAARADTLAADLGDRALAASGDVNDDEAVAAALDAASSLGVVSVAVNVAGGGVGGGRTLRGDGTPHEMASFAETMAMNAFGTFNVVRLVAAAMGANEPDRDGQRGVIVNTASIAAFDGQIGQVAYSASKGGVVGMTLPAARDLARHGIRVLAIAPGTFDTPMLAKLPDDARQALETEIPFPSRLGRTDEYALLVTQILDNSYMNGEVIRIDGALRMAPR
jgi:NAD(P)-dependent dehydrogenase (short-subunit alcohol dehydrogenase family)